MNKTLVRVERRRKAPTRVTSPLPFASSDKRGTGETNETEEVGQIRTAMAAMSIPALRDYPLVRGEKPYLCSPSYTST